MFTDSMNLSNTAISDKNGRIHGSNKDTNMREEEGIIE